jgi:hypothetical protein
MKLKGGWFKTDVSFLHDILKNRVELVVSWNMPLFEN